MKRRIFERFDPNAIDGDEDGLVQDATVFERPSKPSVSGSMRRTLPEGLFVPAERPLKRRKTRGNWRRSGYLSEAQNSENELYDEGRGPADPRSTTRLSLGNTRSVQRSLPSGVNERIMSAREERLKYYEQFRDPETGILKFPTKHTGGKKDNTLRLVLEEMSKGLEGDVNDGLTLPEIAKKYNLSAYYIRNELKKQKLRPIHAGTKRRLTKPRKQTRKSSENIEAMRAGLFRDAKNGLSIDQIMDKYKVSSASVKNELRYQRLKLRRKGSRQRPAQGKERTKYDFMRAGLADDAKNGLNIQDVAKKYDVHISTVQKELRRQNLKLRRVNTSGKPAQQAERRGVSGSMSWGRFNPPKPQLRDVVADLGIGEEDDEQATSRGIEKPKQFNIGNISMRQWNEFSSDMMAYLQDSLSDPRFEYGDYKTQSRERRRSLMRAIAAIKQANVVKNEDGTLSMDFTDEGIRRLRTVLRVLKEQEVEGVRHIDAMRDNLPNRRSRGSQKSAWPTRTIANVKDALGVPMTIRLGDPDVFDNQTSALKRSRDLGCIGIRRYSTSSGGIAWMPCTNESDYRRRRGIGPQAQRDRDRKERATEERIARRVTRLIRGKDAGIAILEKAQRKDSVIQFIEIQSEMLDGRRFVSANIGMVLNNE